MANDESTLIDGDTLIDYMVCNIDEFGEKYGWKIFPPAQRGGEAILLRAQEKINEEEEE